MNIVFIAFFIFISIMGIEYSSHLIAYERNNMKNQIEEFTSKLERALSEYYSDEYDVSVTLVDKNNGVKLHGITIRRKGMTIAPTFYAEHFFDSYEAGETLSKIVHSITEYVSESDNITLLEVDYFDDYDKVKASLEMKLVNTKLNEEYLKNVPSVQFNDLSAIFMVVLCDERIGNGGIVVKNEHIELWGVDIKTLYDDAKKNMMKNNPFALTNIIDILSEIKERREYSDDVGPINMYVLTNNKKVNGAVTLMYDNMLDIIAEKMHGDYYILPSSIHEVIILPKKDDIRAKELTRMVNEVNNTSLDPQEILADHAYEYLSNKHILQPID